MNQTQPREFLHSWYLLLITMMSLTYLLINKVLLLDLLILVLCFYFYLKNGLSLFKFQRFFGYAFFFSGGFFLLNVLYPSNDLKMGDVFHFYNFVFYQASLEKAFTVMLRLLFVSFLSMSSGSVINYTKVVLHLIVHKGLRLFWGYPFLLALNSIVLFKTEFQRIRINAKLRQLPWQDQLSLFFPLLVFAIRHSQRGALALVTRGLAEEKTFYFSYDLSRSDKSLFRFFLISYFFLVGIAIYFR